MTNCLLSAISRANVYANHFHQALESAQMLSYNVYNYILDESIKFLFLSSTPFTLFAYHYSFSTLHCACHWQKAAFTQYTNVIGIVERHGEFQPKIS